MSSPRVAGRAILAGIAASLLLAAGGCRPATAPSAPETAGNPTGTPPPRPTPPPPEFRAETALHHARHLAGLGPRVTGSPAHAAARTYCLAQLEAAGWTTMEQPFDAETPDGPRSFVNAVARFDPSGRGNPPLGQDLLVGAHYDSCDLTPPSPAANDGASGPSLLPELARVLAATPALAARVELVLFDGREPRRQFAPNDGLYGSRFHAQALAARQPSPRLVIVLGMVGGHDARYTLAPGTPAALVEALQRSLPEPDRARVVAAERPAWDDHLPFIQAGWPALLLTDTGYPFVRTADDSAARLDPDSLARTGRLVLHLLAEPPPPAAPAPPPPTPVRHRPRDAGGSPLTDQPWHPGPRGYDASPHPFHGAAPPPIPASRHAATRVPR